MKFKLYLITIICLLCMCHGYTTEGYEPTLDLNRDGIMDVSYEFEGDFYYEFIDRNFDGKIDESHKYTKNHILVSSKIDEDKNGILETSVIYKDTNYKRSYVDENYDGLFEYLFLYDNGVLNCGFRVRSIDTKGVAKLGFVSFKFGYPMGDEVSFHIKAKKLVPIVFGDDCKAWENFK